MGPMLTGILLGLAIVLPSSVSAEEDDAENKFEECIADNRPWSECYNTLPGVEKVGEGFSGFYDSVFTEKKFETRSIWLRTSDELVTGQGQAG